VGGGQSVAGLVKAMAALEMVDADRRWSCADDLPLRGGRAARGPRDGCDREDGAIARYQRESRDFGSRGSSSSGVMRMR